MKYFLIAGEASGDLHASNLMAQIKQFDKDAEFRFFGGDLMQAVGGTLLKHYREMAYMGIFEVVANMDKVKANLKLCKEEIIKYKPDAFIAIDYPAFNLRMAKVAKKHGIKTFYYISPKVWAWKKKRAFTIKKLIDKMFVIFPFETEFYKQYDYPVEYVGNPLVDAMKMREKDILPVDEYISRFNLDSEKPIIALVPGSRKSEIKQLLPEMLKMTDHFREYQFVIAGAPGIDPAYYNNFVDTDKIKIVFGQTYTVIKHARAAIVASGTATLETAFLNTPQVVVYKFMKLSYLVGKPFVRIRFFSLVNIILNIEVVKELLQTNLENKIKDELQNILYDEPYRDKMQNYYAKIRTMLGDGTAAQKTAKRIVELIRQNQNG